MAKLYKLYNLLYKYMQIMQTHRYMFKNFIDI